MASKPYNAAEITVQLATESIEDFGLTAFAILRNLIFASPVGNPTLWQGGPDSAPPGYVGGHFRRNWIVSIGGFSNVVIDGVDPAGAATAAEGQAVIRGFTRGRPGPNLVIQNNVPYANRLALGHSTQAPAGWVDSQVNAALDVPGGRKDLD